MSKDPNIEILKQKGFKKIVLKETDYKYDEAYHDLFIDFSLDTPPTFKKLIIDLKDIFNVFESRLKSYGITSVEEYLSNEISTQLDIYFIAKKSDNKAYVIYFENGEYFKSKGYTKITLYLNSFFPKNLNPIIGEDETKITIQKILNNIKIYKDEISLCLGKREDQIISIGISVENEPFPQPKQNEDLELKNRKNDKAYNYLLAYYLHHEKNHSNCKFTFEDVL